MYSSLSSLITRNAIVRPDEPATVMGERRRTWGEFLQRVKAIAGALRAGGVRPGDRVGILALNSDYYFELVYAIPWAGAVAVPVNIRLAPPEITHWLCDSEAEYLFVDAFFAETVAKLRDRLPVRQVWGMDEQAAEVTVEHLAARGPSMEDYHGGGDDLAFLMYTGGTTGPSKGVMLSHRNLLASVFLTIPTLLKMQFEDAERFLRVAPMFHAADMYNGFTQTMLGSTHVFVPYFDPKIVLQAIQEHRPTYIMMVPTMLSMLLAEPGFAQCDLSSLRRLGYGASPMPEAVLKRAQQALPHVDFFQGYGQTEAAPMVSVLTADDHRNPRHPKILSSAGQPIPGIDIRIVDDNDRALPPGEVGEVCVRGDNVMRGYWKQPEKTAETLRNGWLHTGDGGYLEDGYLYIVDRVKDMIVSGGENIYSGEVEQAIYRHPAVEQCAVIGIPHDEWGEQVHAIVVLKPDHGCTEEELIVHCREWIAGYKCPRSVTFRSEPLPLSGVAKVLKNELRKPFWEGRERSVN